MKVSLPVMIAVAVAIAIWFFKEAVTSRKNLALALLVAVIAACSGFLWAGGFVQVIGLPKLLGEAVSGVVRIVASLAGAVLVAASVRSILYEDSEPTGYDVLAVCFIQAGALVAPLLFWAS